MSIKQGQRITFKRAKPNPLFQDWLEELQEEAQQKKSKLESVLTEALTSISKYPLPLETGAECSILKGFDKRLCLYLDKRLEAHNISNSLSPNPVSNVNENNLSPFKTTCSTNSSFLSQDTEKQKEIVSNNDVNKEIILKGKYKPAYRSGSYAILMALLDHRTNSNEEILQKDKLIDLAQKYSEESFTRPKPDTYYTAWSNMSRLITKGLVKKTRSRKAQYSLTELGITIAEELLSDTKNTPTINDIIFNDQQYDFVKIQSVGQKEIAHDTLTTRICKNIPKLKDNKLNDELIIMEPGSFDIVLLIDKNETSGVSKKNDPTMAQFNKFTDLKHDYRSLKVGDFTWVARHRISSLELVLPYVVERKRMDDLGASIKDGRFHEQKFRLKKCGLKHVVYMVENYGSNNKHLGLPVQTLMQALANTRIQDGFKVHMTESLTHSTRFLAMMTLRLTYEFKNRTLKGYNKETNGDMLMTFEFFNKSSLKNKPLSVTDTFIKLLLQLKGVSVEKALAITNIYKSPKCLIKAYKFCTQKEGELLLANLRCGEFSRNVGPSVSKTVYQLFTFQNIS